jgi:hypothetical protein
MTRALFDALSLPIGDAGLPADPWSAEDALPHPFLRALAQEGRVRRAARELAQDEFMEGTWVEAEAAESAPPQRLAAKDSPETPTVTLYEAGPWRIRLTASPDGTRSILQEAGPAGGTIVLPGEPPTYVPLLPHQAATIPSDAPTPMTLDLLDAVGRTTRLRRR